MLGARSSPRRSRPRGTRRQPSRCDARPRLNCATGPAEMCEHLRQLSQQPRVPLSCMPNAGLPVLGRRRRALPADAGRAGRRPRHLHRASTASRSSVAAAAPRPSTCGCSSTGCAAASVAARTPRPEPGVASLYQAVPFRQDTAYLSIGERTNANGSRAFRDAMLAENWEDCVEIARDQTRDGAHLLDLCIDYVGRDGVADMRDARRPVRHRVDAAAGARLHRARRHRGRPGDARRSRGRQLGQLRGRRRARRRACTRMMPIVKEHGAAVVALTIDEQGQARTADWKVAVAERLIGDLDRQLGHAGRGHHRRLPDLPDRDRPGGDPPRRPRDDRGDPRGQAALPRGADHARPVQRLLRAQPGGPHRAQLGLPRRVRQGRPRLGDRARRPRSCRWRGSPTSSARSRSTWSTTGGAEGYDPLARFLDLFEGVDAAALRADRAEELAALPLFERLERRIVDGERNGPRGRPRRGARRPGPRSRSSTTRCWPG